MSPSDQPEPARSSALPWLLAAWEAWLLLEICYLVGILHYLVRYPPRAANFLPHLLPTVWPLAPLLTKEYWLVAVFGWLVAWLGLVGLHRVTNSSQRSQRRLTAISTGIFALLYVLAWPVIFALNLGKG